MKLYQLLLLAFATLMAASLYLSFTPVAAFLVIVLASLIVYALYAKDKSATQSGAWRVPEKTLHTASLLGGWPGALIAMKNGRST